MKIKIFKITGNTRNLIQTEIMFFSAAARSANIPLIKLIIENGDPKKSTETLLNHVDSVLKTMKRQGFVEFFVFSRDKTKSTEIEYLNNKFPDVTPLDENEIFYTVKV